MNDHLNRKLPISYVELAVCKAKPWSRIGGKILDNIIELIIFVILFISLLLKSNTGSIDDIVNNAQKYLIIYSIISFFLNLMVPVITKGQTIGKLAVGTRIISTDGNIGNLVIYLIRQSFFTILALLGQITILLTAMSSITFIVYIACFIQIFVESHGRTLQDMFAKTIVVNDKIYIQFRTRRFYEIDHPDEFIFDEDKSLDGSTINNEEFE